MIKKILVLIGLFSWLSAVSNADLRKDIASYFEDQRVIEERSSTFSIKSKKRREAMILSSAGSWPIHTTSSMIKAENTNG